jgi:hypothetical protein
MATTEVQYGEAITKITRIFNFYLKEARRRDALDGNDKRENSFWELQDQSIQAFQDKASLMFNEPGFPRAENGKCPSGMKSCNGVCIPDSEECVAL